MGGTQVHHLDVWIVGHGDLLRSVVLRVEQALGSELLVRQLGLELRVELVAQSLVRTRLGTVVQFVVRPLVRTGLGLGSRMARASSWSRMGAGLARTALSFEHRAPAQSLHVAFGNPLRRGIASGSKSTGSMRGGSSGGRNTFGVRDNSGGRNSFGGRYNSGSSSRGGSRYNDNGYRNSGGNTYDRGNSYNSGSSSSYNRGSSPSSGGSYGGGSRGGSGTTSSGGSYRNSGGR